VVERYWCRNVHGPHVTAVLGGKWPSVQTDPAGTWFAAAPCMVHCKSAGWAEANQYLWKMTALHPPSHIAALHRYWCAVVQKMLYTTTKYLFYVCKEIVCTENRTILCRFPF
jgi:hypothetical protein